MKSTSLPTAPLKRRINLQPRGRSRGHPHPVGFGEWLVGLEVDRELLHSESLSLSSLDRRVLAQLRVRLTDVHSSRLFAKAFYPPLALAATTVALCLAGEHLHGQWLLAVPFLALYWLRSLVISVRRTALGFEWSLVQRASGSRFAGQEAELEADASADAFERLTDEARELVEGIPSPHPAGARSPSQLLDYVRQRYWELLAREGPLRELGDGPSPHFEKEVKRLQDVLSGEGRTDVKEQARRSLDNVERARTRLADLGPVAEGLALRRARLSHAVDELRLALLAQRGAETDQLRARADNHVREALDHLDTEVETIAKRLGPAASATLQRPPG